MANDFGGDLTEALRAVEGMKDQANDARQTIAQVRKEADRAGTKLRIPTPREPVGRPAVPIPVEVTQYERLTQAVDAQARAQARLNAIRRESKPLASERFSNLPKDDQARLRQLQGEESRIERLRNLAREQTRAQRNLVAQSLPTGTDDVRNAEARRVHEVVKNFVANSLRAEVEEARKAAAEKAQVREEGAKKEVAAEQAKAEQIQRLRVQRELHGDKFVIADEAGSSPAGTGLYKTAENAQKRLDRLVREGRAEDIGNLAQTEQQKTRIIEREAAKRQPRLVTGSRIDLPQRTPPVNITALFDDTIGKLSRLGSVLDDISRIDVSRAESVADPQSLDRTWRQQAGNMRRSMESAFRQSFGQTWTPPPDFVRERQRQQSQRFQFRQDLAGGSGTAEASRILAARTYGERESREIENAQRRQALLGQNTQADNARVLSNRLIGQEIRNQLGRLEEAARLQDELASKERARAAEVRRVADVQAEANRPLRERFGPSQAEQARILAERIAQTPPPPPPPPPRLTRGNYFDTPDPDDRRRRVGVNEYLSRNEVRSSYGGAEAAELTARGYQSAEHAVESYERTIKRSLEVDAEHTTKLRESRLEAQRSVAQYGAFSNSLRRHGAATTEFLTALAQGRTSTSEIGWQALSTAGKFGAWTAASVGVYGALATVATAGRGAIDSMSGINELSRFITNLDTEKAQQQFRDLSKEFNLPISDVVQAYAGMGRVFGTQNESFEAARNVLLATRVGELEVADSTRFLGAIIQGFGLQAADLPTVIDQINAAQNNLNFSIRDGAAGIARAAGSWRAAGGSFSELLAIMATAQRATGASGEVVGTAFRRSAEFIGREENQAKLRAFGIDPTQGIDQVYKQAFGLVQSGAVAGQDINRLGAALASPQLAAVIGPTLQRFELYRQAVKDTREEAARGSARNELAIQLDAISERLSQVGREFERIGSSAAQAGLFDALGGSLTLVNQLLEVTNRLLDGFNTLPEPLRRMLAYGVQLYGAFRLLHRLNIGESLVAAGQAPGASPRAQGFARFGEAIRSGGQGNGPAVTQFRQLTRDLDSGLVFLRARREGIAGRMADLGLEAERAQERIDDALRRHGEAQRLPVGLDRSEREKKALADLNLAQKESNRIASDQNETRREAERLNTRIVAKEQQAADIQRAGKYNAQRGLERAASYGETPIPIAGVVPSFDQPTSKLVQPLAVPGGASESVRRVTEARVKELLIVQDGEILRAADAGAEAAAVGATAAGPPAQKGAERAGRAAAAARRTGGALRFLGGSLVGLGRGLVGMLGPLGIAFAGLMFLPGIIDHFQQKAEENRNQLKRLKTPSLDPDTYRKRLDEADEVGRRQLDAEQRRRADEDRRPGLNPRVYSATSYRGDERERAGARVLQLEEYRQLEQGRARDNKQPVPFRFIEEIEGSIGQDVKALVNSKDKYGDARRILAKYSKEISTSMEATRGRGQGGGQEAKAALSDLQQRLASFLSPAEVTELFRTQSLADVANEMEREGQAIQVFGASRARLNRIVSGYVAATEALGNRTDPQRMQEFQRAQTAFENAIKATTDQFTEDFGRSTSRPQQRQILDTSLGKLKSTEDTLRREDAQRRADLRRAKERRERAERRYATAQGQAQNYDRGNEAFGGGLGVDTLLGGDPLPTGVTRTQNRDRLKTKLDRAKAAVTKARQNERFAGRALEEGLKNIADAREGLVNQFTSNTDLIDARIGRDNARTRSPAQRAQNSLDGARQKEAELNSLIKSGAVKRGQVLALIFKYQEEEAQALQESVNTALNDIEQKGRLKVARGPRSAEGTTTLGYLNQELAYAKAHGADNDKISDLEIQIAEQIKSNAEDAKQKAEEARQKQRDAISATFEYRRSLTDDPVTLARLDEQEADQLVGVGGTRNERLHARANRNEKRRATEQAVADKKLEKLDYLHDVDRLSDEAYVQGMEKVLRGLKKGTEAYRQLYRRIGRFKHDMQESNGDAELTPGDIRLPTFTEIRRFVGGGGHMEGPKSNVNNRNTVIVNVAPGANVDKVYDALDSVGFTVKQAARKKRLG